MLFLTNGSNNNILREKKDKKLNNNKKKEKTLNEINNTNILFRKSQRKDTFIKLLIKNCLKLQKFS